MLQRLLETRPCNPIPRFACLVAASFLIVASSALPTWAGLAEGWRAYESGNYASAEAEWRPLAERGSRDAQIAMGMLADLLKRTDEALEWYLAAARRGDGTAQVLLGMKYLEGTGASFDPQRAYYWLGRAVAGGHPNARALRDALAAKMTAEQLEAAKAFVPDDDH